MNSDEFLAYRNNDFPAIWAVDHDFVSHYSKQFGFTGERIFYLLLAFTLREESYCRGLPQVLKKFLLTAAGTKSVLHSAAFLVSATFQTPAMILCCPTPNSTSIAGLEFKRVYKVEFTSKIILCEYKLWNTKTVSFWNCISHFAKTTEFLSGLYNFQKEILVLKYLCLKSYLTLQNRFIATENMHHSRITHLQNPKRGSFLIQGHWRNITLVINEGLQQSRNSGCYADT